MDTNNEINLENTCIVEAAGLPLSSAPENSTYIITGYKDCTQRQRLSNLGLGIGAILEVIANIYGKPLIIFARGTRFAISRRAAAEILVKHEIH